MSETSTQRALLVFGTGDDIYFSHLPRFQRPDNAQVILDIALDEPGGQALLADRRAGFTGFHTYEPVAYPLAELDPDGGGPARRTLHGTLVRGRTDRGGTPIAHDVVATVREVIYYAELESDRPAGSELITYLCFGRPGRLHLVHRILGRPSHDQVVAARLIPDSVTDMASRPLADDVTQIGFEHAQPVTLGQREFTHTRLKEGETTLGQFHATGSLGGAHGFRAQLEVTEEIYLDSTELE